MLNIGNKTFMNLQEAVGWLLENNALPFQSTANYAGNTEIAMSTLVNPSPAKVRVGSLIFFADSKVSTVVGVTSNSFIVSDQYNDLVDDVVYVSNVALNASGHLIVTLSNGDIIDAGLIKQVTNFSINGSQHLIVNYNDSTSTDLGAIFTGNVNIAGNLTADSIIENMSGYVFTKSASLSSNGITIVYAGIVKNGNKLTLAIAGEFDSSVTPADVDPYLAVITIPSEIGNKLYPMFSSTLDVKKLYLFKDNTNAVEKPISIYKISSTQLGTRMFGINTGFDGSSTYLFRYEVTFLLSQNLAS